jgi:putative FmdB family regulatory protein
MPNYSFSCEVCESITVENFRMADRPEEITCACGGKSHRMIEMPNLMIKEAYVDGTRRKGWSEFKEASKLEKESNVTRDAESRKKIASEIRKLGVNIKKEGGGLI